MMRKPILDLLRFLILVGLASLPLSAQALRIEEGRPFPNLRLPRLNDGQPASRSDYRGRKLVLHVWAGW
ncbi:MAG TPA: hypothetical protein VLU25_01460 [Acidobacteriota bacterium]|nr:hypothetical protein [Acidobacteriota bacterium]